MKKIIFLIILLAGFFIMNEATNAAGLSDAFGDKLSGVAEEAGYKEATVDTNPFSIISVVIQTALSLLGVIFLVLTIYGGFLWMTAAGDEGKVDSAKKIIKNSIIGLIIIVSAYAISFFVLDKLIGTTLKK